MTSRERAEKWLVDLMGQPHGREVVSLAALLDEVRAEAIEECADICDDAERHYSDRETFEMDMRNRRGQEWGDRATGAEECARRIRALASPPDAESGP